MLTTQASVNLVRQSTGCAGLVFAVAVLTSGSRANDCNANGILDELDIATGFSLDVDQSGKPDECEADRFVLAFAGPSEIRTPGPGLKAQHIYECVIIPGDRRPPALRGGAEAWLVAIRARGALSIVDATIQGTIAESNTAFEGNARWTKLTSGEGNEGVISAMAWSHVGRGGSLPEDRGTVVLKLTVEATGPSPVGAVEGSLEYVDDLRSAIGFEPAENLVGVNWRSTRPALKAIPILVSSVQSSFRRGDSNMDGKVDISDSVFTLRYLFQGGATPPCFDAADVDDSGALDLSDGHLINVYLFLGSTVPMSPGPLACGNDPSDDNLSCETSLHCP